MWCAVCGHAIGKLAARIPLPDGRVVCGFCRDRNVLARRLACGHVRPPGTAVVRISDHFMCQACATDSMKALKG